MTMTGNWQLPARPLAVVIFSGIVSLFRWVILAVILLILAPTLLSYFDNPRRYIAAEYLYRGNDYIMQTVGTKVRQYFPTRILGRDRTDWVLIGGFVILALGSGAIRKRVEMRSAKRRMRLQVAQWKRDMQIKEGSVASKELDAQVQTLQAVKGVDRQELLRVFAETKKKLDSMGREVAFLSIDVVGSTEMKLQEDSASVQYDFQEYRKLVEGVFRARGVLKSAWTPDGVMACFADTDTAVNAGKDIIRSLAGFNRTVKLMRRDFVVRCGVNSGYVHFDDATPMEAMSDRVIDIAGHMQKYAEPSTVAVARKIIEPLRQDHGFQHTDKVVDGYEVSAWKGGA